MSHHTLDPILPLFPLGTVLFPGAVLPLHIFEPRYTLMIRRCLETDRTFGVVLIREGWEVGPAAVPFEVGTLARIDRVETLGEGKLNIAVVGERRFRIRRLIDGEPYVRGAVEFLAEAPDPAADDLIGPVRQRFAEYVRLLRQRSRLAERSIDLPTDPVDLSFLVAANLQVTRIEQQRLLETAVGPRLRRESEILQRELTLLHHLGAVTARRPYAPSELSAN